MKNILPLFFLLFSRYSIAQVNTVMPPQAINFYDVAMPAIKPQIKSIIEKNANKLRHQKVDVDSLISKLHTVPLIKNGNENDLQAIAVLILVQLSKDADADLKLLVLKYGHAVNQDDETSKKETELLVANKSAMAASVTNILKHLSGSAEMAMEKFK